MVRLAWRRGSTTNEAALPLALRRLPAIEAAEAWPDQLAYLRLNGVYTGTTAAVAARLREWDEGGRFGLVLDLRGAAGDDDAGAADIAGRFIGRGDPMYVLRDRAGRELEARRGEAERPLDLPLMVLVDGETTGAAERLAALLAGSVRGVLLVGAATSGDPGLREALPLADGLWAWMATRTLAAADGATLNGSAGLAPDVRVTELAEAGRDYDIQPMPDRRQVLEEERADRALRDRLRGDGALRRAVDILLGLKALNIRGINVAPHALD